MQSFFSEAVGKGTLFFYPITVPSSTGGTSLATPRKSSTATRSPVVQDSPPQNPLTPQANDGTLGEHKVFIEFEFMCSLSLPFARSPYACLPHGMYLICSLLTGWISPVRALCIILSVNSFLCLVCMYKERVSFHRNRNICKAWTRYHSGQDFSPVLR